MSTPLVILDSFPINPGDVTWQPLEAIGPLTLYDRTAEHDVAERARGFELVLTNKTPLSAATLKQLPAVRYIGVLATGYNIVDVAAAHRQGIVVTNVPDYSRDSVAQLVFAFILEWFVQTAHHDQAVKEGRWIRSADFSFTVAPVHELAAKVLGIVGFGSIGKRVARIGYAFGMHILATGRSTEGSEQLEECTVLRVPLDELLQRADVVSLHCPLTPQTRTLMDASRLKLMKKNAFLINTSRGPLVDESALATALTEKQIAGAAVDVLSSEPPSESNPLLRAPHCLFTPHIGWASVEARTRLIDRAAENLRTFLAGSPINVVYA